MNHSTGTFPTADMGYICGGFGETGPYRYCILGDTLIQNTTYSKIYYSSFINLNPPPSPNCPPFSVDTVFSLYPWYFLREDTIAKKVWRYSTFADEDELLYDSTLQQGDSIENIQTGTFHTIDTIYYITTNDGISRKKYEYGEGGFFPGGFYIEGIGGVAGLFELPFYFFEEGTWLMCVKDINNNNIYGNNNCYDFITNVPSVEKKYSIMIFPNPFTKYLNIETSSGSLNVKIYNLLGKELLNEKVAETKTIDMSSLNQGIYILKITQDKNELITKKIIKTRAYNRVDGR